MKFMEKVYLCSLKFLEKVIMLERKTQKSEVIL